MKLNKEVIRFDSRTKSILIDDTASIETNKDVLELINQHNYQFQLEIQFDLFNPTIKVKRMINDAERTAIKTHIGKHYSLPIIKRLDEKGIKPLEAEKWTLNMIQHIVTGNREHSAAELEILQLVADRKKEKEEQLRKRQELISQ